MTDANVVIPYKNQGDRNDCNNYRSISLISIVGKVFARVVLKRLQVLAEQVYPESQSSFRANISTIDKVFSLRQLQEKCREQRQPLFVAFIDRTKTFDLWLVGTASSKSFPRSDVHPNFSATSDPSTKT